MSDNQISSPVSSSPQKILKPISVGPKNKVVTILTTVLSVFLILIAIIGTLGFFLVYVPGRQLYSQINLAKKDAADLKQSLGEKDLDKVKQNLVALHSREKLIEADYKKLSLVGSFPFIKNYYQDGKEALSIAKDGLDTGDILVKAIEPYKDFMGLKGAATDSSQTTEDRITFLTESIQGLVPYMDTIDSKISSIETSLDKIDPSRYPEEFRGYKIKSSLVQAQETVADAHKFLRDGKPILTKTSWLLGKDQPRQYFIMFQNNAELRPTGGFWTAYGIIKVDKGKITPLASDDIYTLDAKFNSTIPAPRPIKAYHINVPYLNLRDMNISPDFPTSVSQFLGYYNKITGNKDKVDAVIGIDTQVLVDLVKVLGRVGVSGFGNFSSDPDKRCDGCPQIIYQLEYLADKPVNYVKSDRKGFLSPLMNSLLSNAMGSEKGKIGPLAQSMLDDIFQKHILFYFNDPQMQQAAVLANIAGSITTTDKNTDYLHINDANMASAKTNLFINEKIKHEIISQNGKVEHKITITYTNPSRASNCNLEKGDLCLNASKYRDWFRFYVPQGSTLTKMTGSEVVPVQYEELGKQVFEGFFGNKYPLYAQSSLKTSIQYTSGVPAGSSYTLLLQKQPGTKPIPYELWLNGVKQETFNWTGDKTIKLSL